MAQSIAFHTPPRDVREVLRARVEGAPEAHAEAVLAAYDVLQLLHDRGILDVAKGALTASDQLLDQVVEATNTPDGTRALRNLLFLSQALGSIEPEWLQGIAQAIPEGVAKASAQPDRPTTLWAIIRRAMSKDSLRGLGAAVDVLESVGRQLRLLEGSSSAMRRG